MDEQTTQNQTNWGRVISGGIAAGIGMLVIGYIINVLVIPKTDAAIFFTTNDCPQMFKDPAFGKLGMYLHFAVIILAGIGVAYLYSLARNGCCGPGAKTAICVGIVIGLLMGLPGSVGASIWSHMGRMVPFWWTIDALLECVIGALIAGAIYKPKNASGGGETE